MKKTGIRVLPVKVLAFIFALLTAAFVCACSTVGPSGGEDDSTTVAETTAAGTTAAETTSEPDIDFDDVFDGKVTILYWTEAGKSEFFVEEQKGDRIGDAIYLRNIDVQNRLGIKLEFVGTSGNYESRDSFVAQAEKSVNSGGEYDIFAGYSMTAAPLTIKGLAYNLSDSKYINFDKPWWPDNIVKNASINDKMYFCSGDISTCLLNMMYVTFFNKEILDDYPDLENPYDLFESNKWRLDKFLEMAQSVHNDVNGDGKKDRGDLFGLSTLHVHYDAFFLSAGLKSIDRGGDGYLAVSDMLLSEKAQNVVADLNRLIHETDACYSDEAGSLFARGNVLFTVERSDLPLHFHNEMSFKYGIVPVPKLEENDEYATCLGFGYTMYTVSSASKDPNKAAATLECLGREGYRRVTPELFEVTLKYKYSSDNQVARIYDLVRSKVDVDLGRIFSQPLDDLSFATYRNAVRFNQTGQWMSVAKANKKLMEKKLEGINEALAKLDK